MLNEFEYVFALGQKHPPIRLHYFKIIFSAQPAGSGRPPGRVFLAHLRLLLRFRVRGVPTKAKAGYRTISPARPTRSGAAGRQVFFGPLVLLARAEKYIDVTPLDIPSIGVQNVGIGKRARETKFLIITDSGGGEKIDLALTLKVKLT